MQRHDAAGDRESQSDACAASPGLLGAAGLFLICVLSASILPLPSEPAVVATGLTNSYSVLLDFLPFYHIYGMIVLMA